MGTSKFEISDYLDSKEMIAEYLNTVLLEGNNDDIINAIGHIAKAIGMTKIAEETGLTHFLVISTKNCHINPDYL